MGGGGGGVGGLGSSGAAASGTSPDMEQAPLSEQLNHRTSESLYLDHFSTFILILDSLLC